MTGQLFAVRSRRNQLRASRFSCISEFFLHGLSSAQTGHHQADFFVGYFGGKGSLQRGEPRGAESRARRLDDWPAIAVDPAIVELDVSPLDQIGHRTHDS